MEKNGTKDRPNLHRRLFWEFRYEDIDWQKEYAVIIQRVIERGTTQEWEELIRFYGKDKVIYTLKEEMNYLPDEIIEDACNYFDLKLSQLKCYVRNSHSPDTGFNPQVVGRGTIERFSIGRRDSTFVAGRAQDIS